MRRHRLIIPTIVALVLCGLPALAQDAGLLPQPATGASPQPTAQAHAVSPLDIVPVVNIDPPDRDALAVEDAQRQQDGLAPRFAIPYPSDIRPNDNGLWDQVDETTLVWRLRITSAGAPSINLGFTRYVMPAGGRLFLYSADLRYVVGPFTEQDNHEQHELWTPVVLADDVVVEVTVPLGSADALELTLGSINIGYRGFGELVNDRAGSCNIDVICPQGNGWRDQIQSVAVISTGGSLFCTGFAINSVTSVTTPYFMTAYHCGITSGNAASLVAYWNFYSPTCGQHGGGSLSQYSTGATFRAAYSTSDFTLVQWNSAPSAAFDVVVAGWDHTSADPTSAVGIHHPNCDEKSISFDYGVCPTTSYLGGTSPGDGTHIKTDWDVAVTEPGSSGSPLFNQDHRIVGQLHGGYSACGNSDLRDWYGRFSRSWTGGGTDATRLSTWLDPNNTTNVLDARHWNQGMQVTPSTTLSASGAQGGPFAPASIDYTIKNVGTASVNYQVTNTQPWVSLTNATGTLAGGATVTVTVSINAAANGLGNGHYADTVTFTNTTDGSGNATRAVALKVGVPSMKFSYPLDTDPNWAISGGQWAFGHPTGGGGSAHGFPDPANGCTGANVYGVNLGGDYSSVVGGPYYLTLGPVDLSNVTETSLRFKRWLNSDITPYATDTIQVSSNGTTWTTLWTNGATAISENAWSSQSYDSAATADNQATVYFRWSYKIANYAYLYSGWNIDDVEIWGLAPSAPVYPKGDMNCDLAVNNQDIDPFVQAIFDPAGYASSYPDCDIVNGDFTSDGAVNNQDIDGFVAALLG